MWISAHIWIASLVIFWGSHAFARSQTGVEYVNGFEVHFVDSGAGDEFTASFQVSFGRLSESREFIGRAHLVQKMIAAQVSVPTAAFTDFASTTYSSQGRLQDARSMLHGLLAPVRGELEWNEETFLKLRSLAVAEAKGQIPIAEEDYLFAMMFGVLLPKRHAWSVTPFGDPNAIARMSLDSIRGYYLANYRPENVKITVRGNFSDPDFFESMKMWTQEALPTEGRVANRSMIAALSGKWAPSLFANSNAPTESDRRLYIASPTDRFSLALLEGDLRRFPDFSPIDRLVTRLNAKPFAENAFFYAERIGSKVHLIFMAKPKADEPGQMQALNEEAFRRIRAEQLAASPNQAAAQLFHPARALYVEMGPPVAEMDLEERFQRAYKLIDNRAAVRRYSEIFSEVGCEKRLWGKVE